ncbi:DUF2971 domain-containing protein [Pseudarthrobacter sp. fls2-241-R2A-168]|uniref:DUF2971 domain-containing protein n=1 Tax=Pseudarthrobacter sp. fls2-241-R2A-168 TaxID=3040304 RepID=UPI00255740C7|nr:DUF2971 domain-containing protein [Pseudarthrobacter sp. fls2-241-R2A-168]
MFATDSHPSFTNVPDDDSILWRYVDLPRFLSLLEEEAIPFIRLDQMRDKWEGAYTQANLERNSKLYRPFAYLDGLPVSRREKMLRTEHINCWHESPEESAAMWDIYQRDGRGVAVRTTWGDLKASLGSENVIYGARVKYADYKSELIREDNLYYALMNKRKSFAHEREVRLITSTAKREVRHDEKTNSRTTHYASGPIVLPVAMDLNRLISSVYVAPDAQPWIAALVTKIVKRYGYDFEVRQSDLYNDPVQ